MLVKPHKLIRIIGVLMASLLTLGVLFGCSSEPDTSNPVSSSTDSGSDTNVNPSDQSSAESTQSGNPSDTTTVPGATTVSTQKGSAGSSTRAPVQVGERFVDLKGRTVKLFMWGYSKEWANEAGKRAVKRFAEIEKNFNCKFKVVAGPGETDFDPIFTSILSGAPSVDIVDTAGPHTIAKPIKGDLYLDLNQFGVFNWKESKWNKNANSVANFGGKQYVAYANLEGSEKQLLNAVLFFNKRLVKNAGYNPDDIYKWQKNGTWTWSKFEEVATKISKLDKGNVWGTVGNDKLLYDSFVTSNGTDWIKKSDKKIIFNAGDAKALQALNMYVKFYQNNVMPEDDSFSNPQMFLDGKVGFLPELLERLRYSNTYGKMKDDYGVVMFPKGPNAKDYVSTVAWFGGYAIPTGTKDAKSIAKVVNFMCDSHYPNKAEENKDTIVARESYVRDEQSLAIFEMVASRTYISPQWLAEPVRSDWLNRLSAIKKGDITAANAVAENKDNYANTLKDVWNIK